MKKLGGEAENGLLLKRKYYQYNNNFLSDALFVPFWILFHMKQSLTLMHAIVTDLATPFWIITLPECKCPKGGKPLSCKNKRASSI